MQRVTCNQDGCAIEASHLYVVPPGHGPVGLCAKHRTEELKQATEALKIHRERLTTPGGGRGG